MSDDPKDPDRDSKLNPALKSRVETSHNTSISSRAPHETASVQHEEGRAWPMIWMAVTLLGIAIVIYLLV